MRKFFILLLTVGIIVGILFVFKNDEHSVKQEIIINKGAAEIETIQYGMDFLSQDKKIYLPFTTVANKLNISILEDTSSQTITVTYSDGRQSKINTSTKQYYKQGLWQDIDLKLYQENIYVSVDDVTPLIERQVHWDSKIKTLSIYNYAYRGQGQSIKTKKPFKGFRIDKNTIVFADKDLPQARWGLNGDLIDFRLLERTKQTNVEEFRYAAFYQLNNLVSQLLFTQRILPNGDQMIFVKAFSPRDNQVLHLNMEPTKQVYGSEAYHYVDYGEVKTWPYRDLFQFSDRVKIKSGESVDQWYVFSNENLDSKDTFLQNAWASSMDYHKTNTWVTDKGTLRRTPGVYFDQSQEKDMEFKYQNINLQASVPMLLMEALQVKHSRLLEDFVHNAKFTLIQNLGKDGYWRTSTNTAYLNRSYGLGSHYIDTRMSVDASLFLLRYGLMFDDESAIEKGMLFKNYFIQLKEKGVAYYLNAGYLYPDYYSEQQRNKTIVSLNHAVYEINYLYTLYNWFNDEEAKGLADQMLRFIRLSKEKWISANGDLYYGLSPKGEYYGKDYINVTYMDLFTLKSIFHYSKKEVPEINDLFLSKGNYLDEVKSTESESHLHLEQLYQRFDKIQPRRGSFFFSYPLTLGKVNEENFAFLNYGTYQWLTGVGEITFQGKTIALDPNKKYFILITKTEVYVFDGPVRNIDLINNEFHFDMDYGVTMKRYE